MNQIILRNALPSDSPELAELSCQLGYPSNEVETLERLKSLSEEDGNLVLVAELEGKVVGWIHAFIAYRLESPPFVEIGGLVVNANRRGAGIGGKLVTAVAHWTKNRGFTQLKVRSNVVREDTHHFYLKLGFTKSKSQIVFSLPI
ncbi:MAG: GNAT family N-acetyltransferase [Candidatus Riflebacteria bacterium]|nr:GNAT family N-acetyltransferase [Candidatus Riflebacteria bacterium]